MRILCAYSGLQFQVQHFPGFLHSREYCHPVFYMQQRELLVSSRRFYEGSLTGEDSYLLFLALLNSTDKVEFRTPAQYHSGTAAIVARNLSSLVAVCEQFNSIQVPSFQPPHFVINAASGTARLENCDSWLETWRQSIKEFHSGYRQQNRSQTQQAKEEVLATLIKDVNTDVRKYASLLANWASLAGDFPTSLVTSPSGAQVRLDEYWKSIIVRACREEELWNIHNGDLQELIEHCEDAIPHGTIFAHKLMHVLREACKKQGILFDIGDWDIASLTGGNKGATLYTILDAEASQDSDTTLAANIKALIASAPDHMPVRSEYPSEFQFMKAMGKWKLAQRSQK